MNAPLLTDGPPPWPDAIPERDGHLTDDHGRVTYWRTILYPAYVRWCGPNGSLTRVTADMWAELIEQAGGQFALLSQTGTAYAVRQPEPFPRSGLYRPEFTRAEPWPPSARRPDWATAMAVVVTVTGRFVEPGDGYRLGSR